MVGYATNGRMGVEAQANYYLINSNAPLAEKARLDLSAEKYPGDDVYTTLDVNLQEVASNALGIYQGGNYCDGTRHRQGTGHGVEA